MKSLKTFLWIILIMYALLCGVLWFGQDSLIFNPHKLQEDYTFSSTNEVEIEVDKDIFLNALWMRTDNPKGAILYLHGNRGSNRRCQHQAMNMSNNGYDILMVDYRGYGKSDGKIYSQKQLYDDVQKVYDYLKESYREDQIILAGYSLGSGMASYLAANNNPQQLVMVAPYLNFYELKKRYIPIYIPNIFVKYPLDNVANLAKVKCPVTLFHGTMDRVIPYNHSEQLVEMYSDKVELITLKKESHRGAIFNGLFRRKFGELAR
ncbi:MAG: alpha/beta fold hydrolase [Bacteroidota bacterium]